MKKDAKSKEEKTFFEPVNEYLNEGHHSTLSATLKSVSEAPLFRSQRDLKIGPQTVRREFEWMTWEIAFRLLP